MNGVDMILEERLRQQQQEGYSIKKDANAGDGILAMAACCYAAPEPLYFYRLTLKGMVFGDPFPWAPVFDKRKIHSRLRKLQIAGALIAAEIDQLLAKGELP